MLSEEDGDELAVGAEDVSDVLAEVSELGGLLAVGVVALPQAESSRAPDAPTAASKTQGVLGFTVLTISLASPCWVTTAQWTCDRGTGLRRHRELFTRRKVIMTGFSHRAWQHTVKLQQAMAVHPFNDELATGTLSRDRFQFYLVQDARYLVGFSRALAAAAAKAPEVDDIAFLAGAARDAIVIEREMHESYFKRFGLSETDLAGIETSPTCVAYSSFLLATAHIGSYEELLAALLPCFWVYQSVGAEILARQTPETDNPYRPWIDTYAGEEFEATVRLAIDAVDRAADAAGQATREKMLAAFTRACEYEWMFWDSAYRQEAWPTAAVR